MRMKAHYGCGKNIVDVLEWLNIDSFDPLQFPVGTRDLQESYIFRCDLTRPHPFENNYFEGAYCQDLFEHFTQAQQIFFLSEVFRTLRPGSELRISAPSLPAALAKLTDCKWSPGFQYEQFDRWHHKCFPSEETLTQMGLYLGFTPIVVNSYRHPRHRWSELDSRPEQITINLFVNLTKPA